MNFSAEKPIYLQIAVKLRSEIVSGKYAPGEQLPAVRDLAQTFAVNPNTVQHAYMQLDSWNLTDARSTAGRFITADTETIMEVRKSLAIEEVEKCFASIIALGYSSDEVKELINDIVE